MNQKKDSISRKSEPVSTVSNSSSPVQVIESLVVEESILGRLSDYAVGKFESLPSRKSVKKAIKRSLLLVNKKPSHTGYWVKEGDVLIVVQDNSKRLVYERELKIIFEDDHIAAVIKPGDVPVSGNSFRTLQNALSFNLKPSMQKDSLEVPRPVHRLDRQTSGVLLIAKTRSSAAYLGEQFEKRRVHKTYLACISGKLDSRKTYSSPIEDKEALTEIKPFQKVVHPKFGEITSIEANPKTGRRNQIRIHLSEEGFPILGDLKFGGMKSGRGLFLFAQKIAFNHPETNELISLEAEVPKKFLKVMGGRS